MRTTQPRDASDDDKRSRLRSEVAFVPTAAFVRAFGATEAAKQAALVAKPTWQTEMLAKLPVEATKPQHTPSIEQSCMQAHGYDERVAHAFAVGFVCGLGVACAIVLLVAR